MFHIEDPNALKIATDKQVRADYEAAFLAYQLTEDDEYGTEMAGRMHIYREELKRRGVWQD